jgi:hypothetical protein
MKAGLSPRITSAGTQTPPRGDLLATQRDGLPAPQRGNLLAPQRDDLLAPQRGDPMNSRGFQPPEPCRKHSSTPEGLPNGGGMSEWNDCVDFNVAPALGNPAGVDGGVWVFRGFQPPEPCRKHSSTPEGLPNGGAISEWNSCVDFKVAPALGNPAGVDDAAWVFRGLKPSAIHGGTALRFRLELKMGFT